MRPVLAAGFLHELTRSSRFGPGSATLWSSIRDQPDILSATVPLPIIVAVGRADSEENLSLSSPIVRPVSARSLTARLLSFAQYEMSPFEFGTTDPSLETGAFIPIDFLGSSFEQGQPGLSCMTGFENAGCALSLLSWGRADNSGAQIFARYQRKHLRHRGRRPRCPAASRGPPQQLSHFGRDRSGRRHRYRYEGEPIVYWVMEKRS